jgi:hypothetical protein
MSKVAILFSISVLLHMCASEGLCTGCVTYPIQRRAFRSSHAVFLGRIVSVDDKSMPPESIREFVVEKATFNVERTWKGKKLDQISVWHMASSSLGFGRLKVGEQMLVYADEQHGELIIDLCGRSKKIDSETDIAKEIGNLKSRWFNFWARLNPF